MWFKNIRLYFLEHSPGLDHEQWQQALTERALQPCSKVEPFSLGWLPPIAELEESLCYSAGDCVLLCAARDERVLPPGVVQQHLQDRLKTVVERTGKPAGRKQRLQLKDEIIAGLLPQAFTQIRRTHAYVDQGNGWLLVNSVSEKTADELAALLRATLPDIKLRPTDALVADTGILEQWLSKAPPAGFEIGGECEFRETGSSSKIRITQSDLQDLEAADYVTAGYRVERLELIEGDRTGLVVDPAFCLRKLRMLDQLQRDLNDGHFETPIEETDARFTLMTLEMKRLIKLLGPHFGLPNLAE